MGKTLKNSLIRPIAYSYIVYMHQYLEAPFLNPVNQAPGSISLGYCQIEAK